MKRNDSPTISEAMLEAIEQGLVESSAQLRSPTSVSIYDMVVHHMGWEDPDQRRGKRIRPLLLLLCYHGVGRDWQKAVPAACALEWLHNFSLIHDDIQDRSEMRRGRETVWKRWGIAQAINTGDALYALAHITYQQINETGIPAEIAVAAGIHLNNACLRLTHGQHRDLTFEAQEKVSQDEYLEMIALKTSSLLSAATAMGAQLAGASEQKVSAYRSYGHHMGLAFQLLDDLLGIWGVTDETGKTTGDDLRARKKTLPVLFGLAHSKTFADWWKSTSEEAGDVQRHAELLREGGALEFTQQLASEHTQRSLASLTKAQPQSPAKEELHNLTMRLLHRQR